MHYVLNGQWVGGALAVKQNHGYRRGQIKAETQQGQYNTGDE